MSTPRNASEIPTRPILNYIAEKNDSVGWAFNAELLEAMPEGTTMTVAMAKMRRIYRAGLATGYAGKRDRGDWEITEKGRRVLMSSMSQEEWMEQQ